ncbi:MAG TPA: SDR family NAD(P)-dependent oxidoreductase [Acidimicrobiales bacterium]|nr:SDR family NAD(P)-dependent oxidoreductase [Acidimicrobiales bacterium]
MGLLEGKIAIVTGAGHGIGRAHAMELARQGAKVLVNDLGSSVSGTGSGRDADETVALIEKLGGEAVANYGDVSDHDQCGELVEQAVDTWARLDILVNNAGIVRDGAVWNLTPADFDAVMAVHVRGSWSCSHHAAVHWRNRSKSGEKVVGRLINTTSGAGLTGNFGQSSYATAKAAIVGLTLTLAQELRSYGVTVNAVSPSGATRITGTMPGAPPVVEPDEIPEEEWQPMDPANSSPLVAWLASDESQLITGQVLRSIHDRVIWMHGWREGHEIAAGERRWEAAELGKLLATDVFRVASPGLRFL